MKVLRSLIVPEKLALIDRDAKSLFLCHYGHLSGCPSQKDDLRNREFKIYSKVGEDGLIAYIFSKIGVTNRRFVEFGIQDGKECNTANLSLNFGWQGMLVDADKDFVESARSYYREKLGRNSGNVKIVQCFITAENINKLLSDNGMTGEVDLLSIDIDGNDYWVWKAVNVINPRVVVAEYNASFGLNPITVKYDPNFHYSKNGRENPLYFGSALPASAKLAKEKGYILIGCDSNGHDAFFVRKDAVGGKFAELTPEEAFYPMPYLLKEIGDTQKQFERVKHLNFEQI